MRSVETASLPLLCLGSFLRAGTKVSQHLASSVALYMSHAFFVEERKQRNSGWAPAVLEDSCYLRCNIFEKQLLDLWPIYLVENVCGREDMGWDLCRWAAGKPDDPPWCSTQREVSQLGDIFCLSSTQGWNTPRVLGLDSPLHLQIPAGSVLRSLLKMWWCAGNLTELFVKNIMIRVSPLIKLR